jgi:hypothetical protein
VRFYDFNECSERKLVGKLRMETSWFVEYGFIFDQRKGRARKQSQRP